MNEANYIRYRKLKGFWHSLRYLACRIFPVKKNRIAVCTFEGRGGFGCNPKYLVQELHRRNPGYEFIWLVNDINKEFPEYVHKVKNTLWNRAYWQSTAKIWIDNYRNPYGTVKRNGQIYINVNHYTSAIKCTGLWRGKGFSEMAYLVSKNDSDMMDALVIDSDWCESYMHKGMLFDGEMLKSGAPRCDILYGNRQVQRHRLRAKHKLPADARIVMYAPTFREGAKNGKRSVFSEVWTIDFVRLLAVLEKRFGGAWYLCIRVHPQLAPTFAEYKDDVLQGRVFDESQADDMYEVLAGVDAYITDYSSAIFEAGYAHIPAFIYADDIQKYAVDRGELMWNLATDSLERVGNNKAVTPDYDLRLPFSVATDNGSLERDILEFDEYAYISVQESFSRQIGLVFDGKGSSRIADWLEKQLRKE